MVWIAWLVGWGVWGLRWCVRRGVGFFFPLVVYEPASIIVFPTPVLR